jgi:hypothetical protein
VPRFFFHIRDNEDLVEDLEGVEMASVQTARDEAVKAAREMLAERLLRGETVDGQTFEICDEMGTKLFSVPFKSVIRLE